MCNFKKGEFKESYGKASRIPWQKLMGKRVQYRFPKKGTIKRQFQLGQKVFDLTKYPIAFWFTS